MRNAARALVTLLFAAPGALWAQGWGNIGMADSGVHQGHPNLQHAVRTHLSRGFGTCGAGIGDVGCEGVPPGHGTMVAGVMVGSASQFFSGKCPDCSLIVGRFGNGAVNSAEAESAVRWVVGSGAQVVNFSLGSASLGEIRNQCSQPNRPPLCNALDLLEQRDIPLVAATGNGAQRYPNQNGATNFPASESRGIVIPVGGVVPEGSTEADDALRPGSPWAHWDERKFPLEPWDIGGIDTTGCPQGYGLGGECGSRYVWTNDMSPYSVAFAAPARDVLTTFVPGLQYAYGWCADSSAYGSGLDTCRGTSFATPLVSATLARIRSANPLLGTFELGVVAQLGASEFARGPTDQAGYGVPDAELSEQYVYGQWNAPNSYPRRLINRYIPLFALERNITGQTPDTMYTAVPQVAVAAIYGELHAPALGTPGPAYLPRAHTPTLAGYRRFPSFAISDAARAPRAGLLVLAGFRNPYTGSRTNVPLYRMSAVKKCADGKLAHFVAAGGSERSLLETAGLPRASVCPQDTTEKDKPIAFRTDGREGYLASSCPAGYDCTDSAPATSPKCVYRRGAPSGDWALLLGNQRNLPAFAGHTATWQRDCIGYAVENVDSDGDTLPDGLEQVIGSSSTSVDSDGDRRSDDQEYPLSGFPFSDPSNYWSF